MASTRVDHAYGCEYSPRRSRAGGRWIPWARRLVLAVDVTVAIWHRMGTHRDLEWHSATPRGRRPRTVTWSTLGFVTQLPIACRTGGGGGGATSANGFGSSGFTHVRGDSWPGARAMRIASGAMDRALAISWEWLQTRCCGHPRSGGHASKVYTCAHALCTLHGDTYKHALGSSLVSMSYAGYNDVLLQIVSRWQIHARPFAHTDARAKVATVVQGIAHDAA